MSLVKKTSKDLFPSLFSDFFNSEDFFNRDWMKADVPAVNIKESDAGFHLELAAPGLDKKDFKIEVENGVLCISAEKKSSSEENNENEDKNEKYTRKEFSYSSFSRSFKLPENIKEDDIKASYKDGVLSLDILKEKAEKQLKKSVEIA